MICTPKSETIFSRPNGLENIAPLLVCITLQNRYSMKFFSERVLVYPIKGVGRAGKMASTTDQWCVYEEKDDYYRLRMRASSPRNSFVHNDGHGMALRLPPAIANCQP